MNYHTGEGLPPDAEVATPLLAAMEQLDQSTVEYLSACGEVSRRPTEENKFGVTAAGALQIRSFGRFIDVLAEGETDAVAFRTAATESLRAQDSQRVDTLNQLIGADILEKIPQEGNIKLDDEENIEVADDAHLIQLLAKAAIIKHQQGFESDTEMFFDLADDIDAARRVERSEKAKERALDIGKVVLGVAAGALIAGLFRNRR